MKIVAIVAEYNPFHYGHLYQIEKIREHFGKDTAIIAIMSGNYTQRGELALMPKVERARAAVMSGVNLVLELPFPFSMASAEHFATGAVRIAHALGVVDVLAFGSESGSIDELYCASCRLEANEFAELRDKLMREEKNLGYAAANEKAYRILFGEDSFTFTSNNILSLMYLRALSALNSKIEPYTIKRVGSAYNDTRLTTRFASASAIREGLLQESEQIFEFCPIPTQQAITDAKTSESLCLNTQRVDSAVLTTLLLNSSFPSEIHEGEDGLYNRLINNVKKAKSISDLITLSETKKYTRARIRRVMWNAIVGVTSSDVKATPQYTQLLASDSLGLAILKKAKKMSAIQILTKPTRYDTHNELLKKQVEMSQKMDMLYCLALGGLHTAAEAVTFSPFIKKD